MDKGKLIVALLLIAIIFSVITLIITMTSEVIAKPDPITEDIGTASVVLEIVKEPASMAGGA
jgi:hypothetical protein